MGDELRGLPELIAEVRAELLRLEPVRLKAQEAFEAIEGPIHEARVQIIRGDESLLRQQLEKLKAIQ